MESELQRYNRLCDSVGIRINTVSFIAKPDQIFELFRAITKDCEKPKKKLVLTHKNLNMQNVLHVLAASKNKPLDISQIITRTSIKKRTLYNYLSKLVIEKRIYIAPNELKTRWQIIK